jgi:chromosome segregation ATPase
MLRKSIIALSIATLLSTAYAAKTAERFDEQTQAKAAAVYSVEQNQWWDEYVKSGKTAAFYIKCVSKNNPRAALWFLTTGGKLGFARRQATASEAEFMFAAMRNIAEHYSKAENAEDAKKAWSSLEFTREGKAHLEMIYEQIDALQEEVSTLKGVNKEQSTRITSLEQRVEELTGVNVKLDTKVTALESKVDALHERVVSNIEAHKAEMLRAHTEFEARMIALMQKNSSDQAAYMMQMFADFRADREAYEQRLDAKVGEVRIQAEQDKAQLQEVIRENKREASEREARVKGEVKETISRFTTILLAPHTLG